MSKVLIDACGWTAIIEGGLNVDLAMADVIGTFEPVLLNRVLKESTNWAVHFQRMPHNSLRCLDVSFFNYRQIQQT